MEATTTTKGRRNGRFEALVMWVGVLAVGAPAAAQDPQPSEPEPDPSTYSPTEEARQRNKLRKARERLERLQAQRPQLTPQRREEEVRIEDYQDQILMVSAPYDPELKEVLLKMGYREVTGEMEFRSGQLKEGRRYTLIPVHREAPMGVIEARAKRHMGEEVRLVLGRMSNGQYVALDVRTNGVP